MCYCYFYVSVLEWYTIRPGLLFSICKDQSTQIVFLCSLYLGGSIQVHYKVWLTHVLKVLKAQWMIRVVMWVKRGKIGFK